MKYYSIKHSLNKKNIGTYPQVVHAKHNCHVWDEPRFIGNVHFEKIDFEPITSNAILETKAKLTDLISSESIGFTSKLLMSGKLKKILENYSKNKSQFFQAPVIFKDELINDYWLLNMYGFSQDYLDFKKSKISVRIKKKEGGTEQKFIKVNDSDDFFNVVNLHKKNMEIVTIDNIYLKDHINDDFFLLQHPVSYVVSENLKNEIEDSDCTGVEFMPIEMSLTEWFQGGEREKKYGKA